MLLLFYWSQQAYANDCTKHYLQKTAPLHSQTKLLTSQLCFNGFSVGYAHQLRIPLWSAEYLTRDRLKVADSLSRTDYFHEETSLPESSQADLEEFKLYGYDRGHLAPHHDMATAKSQYDSFSLANIVLQNSTHNRKYWADIERLTRYQVYRFDDAYIVTGILVNDADITDTGLIIPTHLYKAIYIPKLKQAGVYLSANSDINHTQIMSLSQFYQQTGIDIFPSLNKHIKQNKLALPLNNDRPEINQNNQKANDLNENNSNKDDVINQLINFLSELILAFIKLFV